MFFFVFDEARHCRRVLSGYNMSMWTFHGVLILLAFGGLRALTAINKKPCG